MSMRESRGLIVCAEILACIEQINNVVTNSWTISALLQYAKICLWPWLLFRPQGLFGRKPLTLLISQRLFDRCFFELIIFLSKAISNKFGDNSSSLSQLILFLLLHLERYQTCCSTKNEKYNYTWEVVVAQLVMPSLLTPTRDPWFESSLLQILFVGPI